VKSISVRELRHHWPQAEKTLEVEGEIVITRDSKPVAKLVRWRSSQKRSKKFEVLTHRAWQKRIFGARKSLRLVDEWLEHDRNDRDFW
jgi:antitoxin (DNA-binding transcriptional repressor) of toxin-antitoxin stability system